METSVFVDTNILHWTSRLSDCHHIRHLSDDAVKSCRSISSRVTGVL